MNKEKLRKKILVSRITIDEKLADDLIRVLVCELVEGKKYFDDRSSEWEPEEEVLVYHSTYVEKMGMPPSQVKNHPWENITEGQVFLSGEFKLNKNKKIPDKFAINKGRKQFLRIDEKIKDDVKQLYIHALAGGGR